MSDSLLNYILRRLERLPQSMFWEADLMHRSVEEFEQLISSQLLRFAREDPERLTYPCPSGSLCGAEGRHVVETDGQLWAICTCLAQEPPLRINREGLHRYTFGVDLFVERLRTANDLGGSPYSLDQRFTLIGEAMVGEQTIALVLALLRDETESIRLLESLSARLPGVFHKILVLTPSYFPPPDDAVRLRGLGIIVVPNIWNDEFKVEIGRALIHGATQRAGTPADWPDDHFKDEDGTWLTAKILEKRFDIPNSRLKEWRETGCPDLDGQQLGAKKVGRIGWVYARIHINQIANRRFDQADVVDRVAIATRIDAMSEMKRQQPPGPKRKNSR